MEGLHLLKDLLRENNFISKVDLKDAYFCVPLHWKTARVFVPMFWSGSSILDLYNIIKDSHCNFEADSNQNNNLSGQHIADESVYKRFRNSQAYIDFSIADSKLCYKSAEIFSDALKKIEFPGLEIDSVRMTLALLGKSKKTNTKMSKGCFKPQKEHYGKLPIL